MSLDLAGETVGGVDEEDGSVVGEDDGDLRLAGVDGKFGVVGKADEGVGGGEDEESHAADPGGLLLLGRGGEGVGDGAEGREQENGAVEMQDDAQIDGLSGDAVSG